MLTNSFRYENFVSVGAVDLSICVSNYPQNPDQSWNVLSELGDHKFQHFHSPTVATWVQV